MRININAFCFGCMGVQKQGSSFVRALSRYTDIALFPWDPVPPLDVLPAEVRRWLGNARGQDVAGNTGIGIGVLNRMPCVVGRKKVAYIVWETSRIPERELAYLDGAEEIWIPSTWGKSILEANGVDPHRISVVPEGVDEGQYRPMHADRGVAGRKFRLLCVGKWEKRKGIDVLLRAYARAFAPGEPVELVLHCHNANRPGLHMRAVVDDLHLPPHPSILYSAPVPEARMPLLYNGCDAFVLPTRGEGWGLPIIEAMACAKPVIVTRCGAHLDFVNDGNAYLIDVKAMVRVDDADNFDPSLDFGEWAEPDEEHLAWLLRRVFENRDEARVLGEAARRDVVQGWTWGHAAGKAWELLRGSASGSCREGGTLQ
ncbi:MAG: glycosyltransferase [Arenicellales bacterium]